MDEPSLGPTTSRTTCKPSAADYLTTSSTRKMPTHHTLDERVDGLKLVRLTRVELSRLELSRAEVELNGS